MWLQLEGQRNNENLDRISVSGNDDEVVLCVDTYIMIAAVFSGAGIGMEFTNHPLSLTSLQFVDCLDSIRRNEIYSMYQYESAWFWFTLIEEGSLVIFEMFHSKTYYRSTLIKIPGNKKKILIYNFYVQI